ncbi:MAG: thioredoxin family protein [Oscillospiraceae bacterium]
MKLFAKKVEIHNLKTTDKTNGDVVKILGSGCSKCNQLEKNTIEALNQLRINTAIEHITDFAQIAAYGIMSTPALVYNEKVLSYGRVLKSSEIVTLIKKEVQ